MPSQPSEATAEATSSDKPTPEEERDAAIEEEEIGRLFDEIERDVNIGRDCSENVGPELLEAESREIARELAPLGDKKRRDALDRRRRSDKDEANTTMHLLALSPKNVHCIACRQAKVTNVRFTRGDHEFIQFAKEFGDRATADTIVLRSAKDRGIHGETNAIVLFDFATGWLDCIPVKSRNTDEAVRAINAFRGPEVRIKQLYTDKAPEFGLACSKLGTCSATATPGMPRTNGIAENKVKEIIRGARVLLRQAGLEARWWPFAVRTYCFHQNCQSRDGESPYEKRFGKPMEGVDLRPFGCLVDYLPIAPKPRRAKPGITSDEADEDDEMAAVEEDEDETSVATPATNIDPESEASEAAPAQKAKFDPATSPGIHLGYHLLQGGVPNGDYQVIDFGHLLHAWEKPSVHQIKRVIPEEGGKCYFPMQRVYESRTRMMRENRARAIAEVEIRRERAAIEANDVFDVGPELREETRRHIEDDRQFLQSGDYWENFEDERRWVLHHLCPRYDRLEFKNGDVEELWDDRFSGREKSTRKWVGFSTFWEEGFAPNAPPKTRSPGIPRTRVMGSGLDYEQRGHIKGVASRTLLAPPNGNA